MHQPTGTGKTAADVERYRLLVEAVTDYAIYMLDTSGVVTSWNKGAERFKGYSEAEILGEHFSRFYTPEDRAAGLPAVALTTAARDGRFEREGWRTRKDGTRFWAHVVVDAIRADDGTLLGFAKITRDIGERRRAEEALRRSEEQFRLFVQGVSDYAITFVDPEGAVTSWNGGAERIALYRPAEIIGSPISRFFSEDDRAAGLPEQALATAAATGRFETEGWRIRKDGTRFWAHVVLSAIRDGHGDLRGFAEIARDVTEMREAQRALDETRAALMQSQKMEALGQLTGGIAHDFNNLLAAITGSLELLRKHVPSHERVTRLIEIAAQAADRGASLTRRMLAFARRQDLTLEAVDLSALVTGMADLLQRSAGPSFVIATRVPPGLDRVRADVNQLELALLNLLVNARDAMEGGGEILLAARPVLAGPDHQGGISPGRYVALSVTDGGIGMDAETASRAAEPFFTTKGIGKGTGLGLSMVDGLVRQLGGALSIRSHKGKGTMVELLLPVWNEPLPEGVREAAASAATAPLRVLVVDDDALVLANLLTILEDLGHAAVGVRSAEEALGRLAAPDPIDLVITDHAMPGPSGLELASQLAVERPSLPVILASGYAEAHPGDDAIRHRLAKPFSIAALERAIEEAIGRAP